MSYQKSQNIQVFPTSIARPLFPYARVLTEEHILNITRNASPCSSFVISDNYSTSDKFEFMIHGYYVRLEAGTTFTGDNIYAHIYVDTTVAENPQLWGVDQDNSFTGVAFDNTSTATPPEVLTQNTSQYEHYVLHILTKVNNEYIVPSASKWTADITVVDGGEID